MGSGSGWHIGGVGGSCHGETGGNWVGESGGIRYSDIKAEDNIHGREEESSK